MAEQVPALCEKLAAETTCPLCLDLLAQPVLTACGHSFCRRCLAAVLGDPPRPAACPQCRAALEPGSLRPNHSLGNVAELARSLKPARSLQEVSGRPRCPRHGKVLSLFCEPCSALLCGLCLEGSQHRHHRVPLAEVAATELRETLQNKLLFLQKQKEELEHERHWRSFDLMGVMTSDLQRVSRTFEELQQLLKEQEKILLAQLNQETKELVKNWDEYNSRVLEREALLDTVIAEIEKKQVQPAIEFLTDIDKTLSSCEAAKAPMPEGVLLEVCVSIKDITGMIQLVVDTVAEFKVKLQSKIFGEREKVTLDPETAGRFTALSQDYKTVGWADEDQNRPEISKRFTNNSTVLGSQGFTSGRHYWEMEVDKENTWAVGVALESLPRKEPYLVPTRKEIWALRLDLDGQYKTDRVPPDPLPLTEKLQRIRVHLDYEAGRVTFYNAENMRQIVQLEAAFTEKVFPYFCLYGVETQIRLCD